MAIFLESQEIYRLFQRELPEGVYADGAPSGSYTAASIYSKAALIEKAYENLEKIYEDTFPQSSTSKILDWEEKVFGELLDSTLSIEEKRGRVLAKIRSRRRITKADMLNIVFSVIGIDKLADIIEWGCDSGGWILDVSQLEISTYLNSENSSDTTSFLFPEGDFCTQDPLSEFGKTPEEWQDMRTQAYTYEVLIYGYTLTTEERALLERTLLVEGPARSGFVITDGLNPDDMLDGEE